MAGVKAMNRYTSVDSVDNIYIRNPSNGPDDQKVILDFINHFKLIASVIYNILKLNVKV